MITKRANRTVIPKPLIERYPWLAYPADYFRIGCHEDHLAVNHVSKRVHGLLSLSHTGIIIGVGKLPGLARSWETGLSNAKGVWRRGTESNRRIELLQSSALPLGYRALS